MEKNRYKTWCSSSILFFDNQELLNIVFQFIDTQLFLKKLKCLSKYFNKRVQSTYLFLSEQTINLCLQNIDIAYFSWQLKKFKNRINSLQLFHFMGDPFLECLFKNYPKITNLDISYCRNIKNISYLCRFHHLEIFNIKGLAIYDGDYPIFKVIEYLCSRHSLTKVILSKDLNKIISHFRIHTGLSEEKLTIKCV